MRKNFSLLQTDQADVLKCGSIVGCLGLPAGGDDPDIGICVQYGDLITQVGTDGTAGAHLIEAVQEE